MKHLRYPHTYTILSLTDQLAALQAQFPMLHDATFDETAAAEPLAKGAEGKFLIPLWTEVSDHYDGATRLALQGFSKALGGKLAIRVHSLAKRADEHQCLTPRATTVQYLAELARQQPGHRILVAQAQFGLGMADKTQEEAVAEVEALNSGLAGLGLFAAACMGAALPKRFDGYLPLGLACIGDNFTPIGGDRRGVTLNSQSDERVKMSVGVLPRNERHHNYGAITGFRVRQENQ